MRQSITRTIGIKAPAARVLDSLSRPENLPDWFRTVLHSARRESGKSISPTILDAGNGKDLPVEVIVDSNRGTVDFLWSAGGAVDLAAARVIPVDGESQLVVTLFAPPEACKGCSSLEERSAAVGADLIMLKVLLETNSPSRQEIWN